MSEPPFSDTAYALRILYKSHPICQQAADQLDAVPALIEALEATLCELTACASQLAARGLTGHKDNSVSRAQSKARAALTSIGRTK